MAQPLTSPIGSVKPAERASQFAGRSATEALPPAASDATIAVAEVAVGPAAGLVSVSVTGKLVGDAAAKKLAAVLQQRAAGFRVVLLDLARSPMLDQASLGVIVEAHHRSLAGGGILSVTAVSPRIARMLELTGLDRTLFVGRSA